MDKKERARKVLSFIISYFIVMLVWYYKIGLYEMALRKLGVERYLENLKKIGRCFVNGA